MDLSAFKDTRFVCMGGSAVRAETFAEDLRKRFTPDVQGPPQPIGKTERYSVFKIGPIISASHGIGMPSMLILLHELTKLLHYAGAKDVMFVRIGTCAVTTAGVMGTLEPVYEAIELGERRRYGANLDAALADELLAAAKDIDVPAVKGQTLGTDGFYEAQGRLDGALNTWYTEEDKLKFLKKAYKAGVRNVEMEAAAFGAFTQRAGVRATMVCAVLVNRLGPNGDQITSTPEQLGEFSLNAQRVVAQWMEKALQQTSKGAKRGRDE